MSGNNPHNEVFETKSPFNEELKDTFNRIWADIDENSRLSSEEAEKRLATEGIKWQQSLRSRPLYQLSQELGAANKEQVVEQANDEFMNQLLIKLVNCIKYQADEKSSTDLQYFLSEHKERLSEEHKRAKANADTVEDRYLDLCDDLPLYSVRIHEREIECAGLISNLEYCNKEFWSTLLYEQSRNFNLKLIHSTSSFFDEVQQLEELLKAPI